MEKSDRLDCAHCSVLQCWHPKPERKFPPNCTRIRYEALVEETTKEGFTHPVAKKLNEVSDRVLTEGVDKEKGVYWSRLEELIHFIKFMEYKKIGIAFCAGIAKEAKILDNVLDKYDFDVVSVSCMAGSMDRSEVQRRYSVEISPHTQMLCNPVMQAEILNQEKTNLNVVFGLCIGHDTIFIKYSDADVSPLVVKDRALAHNPIGALHLADTYYQKKF